MTDTDLLRRILGAMHVGPPGPADISWLAGKGLHTLEAIEDQAAATERARIADILAAVSHSSGEVQECDGFLEPWCQACHAAVDDMLRPDSDWHIVKEAREYRAVLAAIEGESK